MRDNVVIPKFQLRDLNFYLDSEWTNMPYECSFMIRDLMSNGLHTYRSSLGEKLEEEKIKMSKDCNFKGEKKNKIRFLRKIIIFVF